MDQVNYTVHQLFPVPVYRSTVDVDTLTYHKLINFEWEDPGYQDGSTPTHKETAERHILNLPQFSNIRKQVQFHVNRFVFDIIGVEKTHEWEITTSWVNKSAPGDFHSVHWHSNSLISGTFYLNADPDTGAIVFHKDRGFKNLWGDTICIDFDHLTDYSTTASAFLPNVGDLLIFPSNLNHGVLENRSSIDRYSLAFNVFPRGVFGKGGNSELTL